MKKLITMLFSFAIIASMTVLSSCGGAPSNEEVHKIIDKYEENKKSLTEKDYDMLVDYTVAAVSESIPIQKEVAKAKKDCDDDQIEKKYKKIDELRHKKYKYIYQVQQVLFDSKDYEMGKANCKRIEDLKEKCDKEEVSYYL